MTEAGIFIEIIYTPNNATASTQSIKDMQVETEQASSVHTTCKLTKYTIIIAV